MMEGYFRSSLLRILPFGVRFNMALKFLLTLPRYSCKSYPSDRLSATAAVRLDLTPAVW